MAQRRYLINWGQKRYAAVLLWNRGPVAHLRRIRDSPVSGSSQRFEDARFIRGKGNYIDDFKLPGMLHMETLRSPIAHARITSIDTSKAWMTPVCTWSITGDMAAQHNLRGMPTLSYDTQAVLATDKVRFQARSLLRRRRRRTSQTPAR